MADRIIGKDKNITIQMKKTPEKNKNKLLESLFKDTKTTNLSLSEKLQQELFKESLECKVCFEYIKNNNKIWNCQICYSCFHLNCIKAWAKTSEWRCPGCNITTQEQLEYYCFCKKQINPEKSLSSPHSCGATCLKSSFCIHKCKSI
jgi:transcriptional repressor NF-X1